MPLTPEARRSLQASIDALKKRLSLDANDLDYESHLHAIRTLQKILDRGTPAPKSADDHECD